MKHLLFVFLCSLLPLSVYAQNGIITQADEYIEQGNLSGARNVLLEAIREKNGHSPGIRASALNRLAGFYEKKVGSPSEALRFSHQVMRLAIGKDHPEKIEAADRIARIKHLQDKYAALESQLGTLRQGKTSVQETRSQLKLLKAVIDEVPDYPYVGQVYFDIGIKHYQLQEFYSAYCNLRRAADFLPGLNFRLPVEFRMQTALKKTVKSSVLGCAWSILAGTIILTGALFFDAKAWRRLKGRHVLLLIGTVCLWGLFLYTAAWLLGAFKPPTIPPVFDKPIFPASMPGEPGSGILNIMCLYGVIAIILAYGLHLGMLRYRFSLTGTYIHAMASLLIFTAVFSIFFYRHCQEVAIFEKSAVKPLAYLNGNCFFPVSATLQNVLTNPRAYPGLSLDNIDEPEVKEWIKRQYNIINDYPSIGVRP